MRLLGACMPKLNRLENKKCLQIIQNDLNQQRITIFDKCILLIAWNEDTQ